MPPTLEDLQQGLRGADAAGDTNAAQQFADEIRKMQAIPPSSAGTPPTPAGVLPAGSSSAGTPAGNNQPTLPSGFTGDAPFGEGGVPSFQTTGNAISDIVRYGASKGTFGGADWMASHMPTWAGGTGNTQQQESQLTEEAGNRLGLAKYPIAAGAYYANPVSDISALGAGAGIVGRTGARAAEGALAGGSESYIRGDPWSDVMLNAAKGSGINSALGGAGELASKAIGNVKPYLPSAQSFKDAADSMWDQTKSVFDRNTMSSLSNKIQSGFRNTGRPYSDAVPKLTDDITKLVQPGGADARQVINLQNRANNLQGDDATYGKMISGHIEDTINAHPSGPGIQQARAADVLSKNYDEISANPPSGYGQWLADQLHGHAFRLGREAPFIGALTAAEGAHQAGYSGLAHTMLALATTVPATGWAAGKVGNLLQNRARDAALRDLTGTTGTPRFDPSSQDAFRKLVFGGTLPSATGESPQ